MPTVAKRELRRGFPKSMVRKSCDLKDAMQKGLVEIIATSGTTERSPAGSCGNGRGGIRRSARRCASIARVAETMRERLSRGGADDAGVRRRHLPHRHAQPRRAHRRRDAVLEPGGRPDAWNEAELGRMVAEWNDLRARRRRVRSAISGGAVPPRARAGRARIADVRRRSPTSRPRAPALRAIAARCSTTPLLHALRRHRSRRAVHGVHAGRLHHNARHSHIELRRRRRAASARVGSSPRSGAPGCR